MATTMTTMTIRSNGNNISPDVMKFIGVLWMVKGVGLSGVTAEELLHIAVAVYLLK